MGSSCSDQKHRLKGKEWQHEMYYDHDASLTYTSLTTWTSFVRRKHAEWLRASAVTGITDPNCYRDMVDVEDKIEACLCERENLVLEVMSLAISRGKISYPDDDAKRGVDIEEYHYICARFGAMVDSQIFGSVCVYHKRLLEAAYDDMISLYNVIVRHDSIGVDMKAMYMYKSHDLKTYLNRTWDVQSNDVIDKAMIYKVPLSESFWTNILFYHAFVIFRSTDGETAWWWSLEKNGTEISFQRSLDKDAVLRNIQRRPRLKGSYWYPQLVLEDEGCMRPVPKYILGGIFINRELDNRYNVFNSNCKIFCMTIFDKIAKRKKWTYSSHIWSYLHMFWNYFAPVSRRHID